MNNLRCRRCGYYNQPNSRFCAKCAKLAADAKYKATKLKAFLILMSVGAVIGMLGLFFMLVLGLIISLTGAK